MIKNKKLTMTLIIYCILFYGFWAVMELLLKRPLLEITGNEFTMECIRSGVIKNLAWTVPSVLLIKHFEKDMYVGLKEMFELKINWLKYIPIYLLCIVYLLIVAWKQTGKIAVSPNFTAAQAVVVLFVGITEESVFRGWLLNGMLKNADTQAKQWTAVIINAVMFLVIHFPIWIYEGVFIRNFANFGFISIMILSVIFSRLFMDSKNILVPIFLHMLYDLLIFMLIS